MNFSPPVSFFSDGVREGGEAGGRESSVDEIRLSFAGERFHLEHEVIALIEVAFITLPYYMLGCGDETRRTPATTAAPTRCTGEDTGGSRGEATDRMEEGGGSSSSKKIAGCLNRRH